MRRWGFVETACRSRRSLDAETCKVSEPGIRAGRFILCELVLDGSLEVRLCSRARVCTARTQEQLTTEPHLDGITGVAPWFLQQICRGPLQSPLTLLSVQRAIHPFIRIRVQCDSPPGQLHVCSSKTCDLPSCERGSPSRWCCWTCLLSARQCPGSCFFRSGGMRAAGEYQRQSCPQSCLVLERGGPESERSTVRQSRLLIVIV